MPKPNCHHLTGCVLCVCYVFNSRQLCITYKCLRECLTETPKGVFTLVTHAEGCEKALVFDDGDKNALQPHLEQKQI